MITEVKKCGPHLFTSWLNDVKYNNFLLFIYFIATQKKKITLEVLSFWFAKTFAYYIQQRQHRLLMKRKIKVTVNVIKLGLVNCINSNLHVWSILPHAYDLLYV